MPNAPKISYLVSTYKSGQYLDKMLWDLQAQTMKDFEVCIVNCTPDGGGEDHEIAQRWLKRDDRIKYKLMDEREPYGTSWIRAWEMATAPIVSNANTDDLHHPDFGQVVCDFFKKIEFRSDMLGKVGFAYTGLQIINEQGQVLGQGNKPPFDSRNFSRECTAGPQVSWRRDIIDQCDKALLHEMALQYRSAFDYALWMYFMSLGFLGYSIPGVLSTYTQRPDSIENSNKWENNWDTFHAMARFFPDNTDVIPAEFLNGSNPQREEWAKIMNDEGVYAPSEHFQNTSDVDPHEFLSKCKGEAVEQLQFQFEGRTYFRPYASVILGGKKIRGLREIFNRFDLFEKIMDENDVDFKSYLDIGCNMGVFVEYFGRRFQRAHGIEKDQYYLGLQKFLYGDDPRTTFSWDELIEDMKRTGTSSDQDSSIRFHKIDINDGDWRQEFPRNVEVITALSMIEYISDREQFVKDLYDLTGKICIVEGHSMDMNDGLDSGYEELLKSQPWTVERRTELTDNGLNAPATAKGRPVWVCKK